MNLKRTFYCYFHFQSHVQQTAGNMSFGSQAIENLHRLGESGCDRGLRTIRRRIENQETSADEILSENV